MNQMDYYTWRDSVVQTAIDVPDTGTARRKAGKVAQPQTVRYAPCPHHAPHGRELGVGTGVVRLRDGTEVFRNHTKRIGSATVPCPGSGMEAPAERTAT